MRIVKREMPLVRALLCVVGLVVGLDIQAVRVIAQSVGPSTALHHSSEPEFEVASIRPSTTDGYNFYFTKDRFIATGTPLEALVQEAFGAYAGDTVQGGPPWVQSDRFDLLATVDTDQVPNVLNLALAQRRAMLQALLVQRFGLVVHVEKHSIPALELEFLNGPVKLHKAEPNAASAAPIAEYNCMLGGTGTRGYIKATHCTIQDLANVLSGTAAGRITDGTGDPNRYDFELRWTPDERMNTSGEGVSQKVDDASYPWLTTALKEQLGIFLKKTQAVVRTVVIDGARKPEID